MGIEYGYKVWVWDIGIRYNCLCRIFGVWKHMWCIGTYIYSVYVDVPYIHIYVKVYTYAYKYIYNILYISVSLLVLKRVYVII